MTNAEVFHKVARGEMTAAEGADLLEKPKSWMPQRPTWAPKWAYALVVLLVFIVLAPILSNSRDGRG